MSSKKKKPQPKKKDDFVESKLFRDLVKIGLEVPEPVDFNEMMRKRTLGEAQRKSGISLTIGAVAQLQDLSQKQRQKVVDEIRKRRGGSSIGDTQNREIKDSEDKQKRRRRFLEDSGLMSISVPLKAPPEIRHEHEDVRINLGPPKPVDEWVQHNNGFFYGLLGPGIHKHFSTLVSDDPKTSFALADDFHKHLMGLGQDCPKEVVVHEYGVGSGMMAAAFLHRMGENDVIHGTDFLKRMAYVLFDSNDSIFEGLMNNRFLMEFKDNLVFAKGNAMTLIPDEITSLRPNDSDTGRYFSSGAVHKQISNELADALPAVMLAGDTGEKAILMMQPYVVLPAGQPSFMVNAIDAYQRNDLVALRQTLAGPGLMPQSYSNTDRRTFEKANVFFCSIGTNITGQKVDTFEGILADHEIKHPEVVIESLSRLDEPWNAVVPHGFFKHLEAARELMSPIGQGYDFFDTGTADMKSIRVVPVVHTKGDFCYSIPFDLVAPMAEKQGLTVESCEVQNRFVSRVLGSPQIFFQDVLETNPRYLAAIKNIENARVGVQSERVDLPPVASGREEDYADQMIASVASAFPDYENIVVAKNDRQVAIDMLMAMKKGEGILGAQTPANLRSLLMGNDDELIAGIDKAFATKGGKGHIRHQYNLLSADEVKKAIPELVRMGCDKEKLERLVEGKAETSPLENNFHHMRVLKN